VSNRPEPFEIDLTTNDVFPIEPTADVVAACEEESRAFVEAQRWKWLDSTYALQREAFGVELPMTPDTIRLADYVVMNHSALTAEAGELLAEFGWKSWAEPRGWVNRENALKEAVDVAHFLANILCAIGVTDEEWITAYQAKQEVNRRRQRDGYDGVSDKCPECKRSYDDDIPCAPAQESYTVMNASGDSVITVERPAYCAYA
jgi:hypothetical protein